SPLASDTRRRSKSMPISCSAMCTAIELDPGEKYSASIGCLFVQDIKRQNAPDGRRRSQKPPHLQCNFFRSAAPRQAWRRAKGNTPHRRFSLQNLLQMQRDEITDTTSRCACRTGQETTASVVSFINPSIAAGSVQRRAATISICGSIQVKL